MINHTPPGSDPRPSSMTLSQLRHDLRNYLNAIKLSCALLARKHRDELTVESVQEIERAVDGINDMVNDHMTDHAAPSLLSQPSSKSTN